MGLAHLEKARCFNDVHNWTQTLRYAELALTKLKKLTHQDRPLDAISEALTKICDALGFMGRDREALEFAKERYNLRAVAHGPAHPSTIDAAFQLIESMIHNDECEQAELFARTLWEILNSSTHHFEEDRIPENELQEYLGRGAYEYARAIKCLSISGGIPPEQKQQKGQMAIDLGRRALEIHTRLHGYMSHQVANVTSLLANLIDYFNDNDADTDEVKRLYVQAIAIFARVEGPESMNVASSTNNMANMYILRSMRARDANDEVRQKEALEQALPHLREGNRIYRLINHTSMVEGGDRQIAAVEASLRQLAARAAARADVAATATAPTAAASRR